MSWSSTAKKTCAKLKYSSPDKYNMRDIDSWIESQLKKGIPPKKVKQILKAKGYSSDVINSVDNAETPFQQRLLSKIRRKNFLDIVAFLVVVVALLFGALYSYAMIHEPSPEEIILNLSEVYSNLSVMEVVGNSMEPTFSDGQIVFVARTHYQNNTPVKGDIGTVYFKLSDTYFVKRIVATPSDKIDENEKYLQGTLLLKQLKYYNYTVPLGTIIIIGDNQESSLDSRDYGVVPIKLLEGKVVK